MILVGQRVRHPETRATAIHGFLYRHEPSWTWSRHAPKGGDGAFLEAQSIVIPVGGNHVLSYLDVICPNETTAKELAAEFQVFTAMDHPPPPWRKSFVRCIFDANIVASWRLAWRLELPQLLEAALSVMEQKNK